jgi:hypothetical protein
VDGLTIALNNFTGEHSIKLITSVGGPPQETSTPSTTPRSTWFTYSSAPPSSAKASALRSPRQGEKYQGQDLAGQLFLIPTSRSTSPRGRLPRQPGYAERYAAVSADSI